MEPLVSILTPCYNGEKFISNYVNSIFKQDYSNIEVIFVDDGSNDATKQLILGYENEFLARKISFQYIWKENNGAASAIEKGIKNVKGKYLTWIDVQLCNTLLHFYFFIHPSHSILIYNSNI